MLAGNTWVKCGEFRFGRGGALAGQREGITGGNGGSWLELAVPFSVS